MKLTTRIVKLNQKLNQIDNDWNSDTKIKELMRSFGNTNGYTRSVTGDAAQGDSVIFVTPMFIGSFRNAKFDGWQVFAGEIITESYGYDKQQHTFTILLLDGSKKRIKGRNLYRIITLARERDEAERQQALDDKHRRGAVAREARETRKAFMY